MSDSNARERMVELQLESRGITDKRVLEAFRRIPRERFLPDNLREFAYEDNPLPIGQGQTISQPFIVARTVEALGVTQESRVLEIGTGSGYAAAILSQLSKEVRTVERLSTLADQARARFAEGEYRNVHVLCADGTLGWPEHAPYDAIAVAAGGPEVPHALLAQLAVGGRLVIPVGPESAQTLTRVTRVGRYDFREERLEEVRFVPLIGEQGWPEKRPGRRGERTIYRPVTSSDFSLSKLVFENAERIDAIDSASLGRLLERMADARVVLLGESTHGTSEFYQMRARISKELIQQHRFDFVAVEADWPDAARVSNYVLGGHRTVGAKFTPFSRFPTWMWRNQDVDDFVAWLRARNLAEHSPSKRVGFHGLDLYSLFTSVAAVLHYLDDVDPIAARAARSRYGTLTPWQRDPAAYGRAVLAGRYESSEQAVVTILRNLLERRIEYARLDGDRFFDAAQNARVVANAEHYYRALYYGSATSWNLRDSHMFDTLEALLAFYGPDSRGIVWAHNSHIGNALATEMSIRGEHNIGQLCREKFGRGAYLVGFGTDHGTVAAAHDWDEPMQRMHVRAAVPGSYEQLFHDSGLPAFTLHLHQPRRAAVRDELGSPRLERAIGVVYRPATELQSHYFQASIPSQFDEFVWFDETHAVQPLEVPLSPNIELPDTYPFGL